MDKIPVYLQNYYESGIVYVNDLLFNLSSNDSFDYFAKKLVKSTFFNGTDLRHSIPDFLKGGYISPPLTSTLFMIHNKKNRKNIIHYLWRKKHSLLILSISGKAISTSQMIIWENFFLLPHSVALKSYVKAFQYKVLNNILYTNKKLFKIDYRSDNVCTFCEAEPETLYHILFQCPYSRQFWNNFESFYQIDKFVYHRIDIG